MQRDIPVTMAALLPFPLFSAAADVTSSKDIVSAADSSAQLATFVGALEAAGLVDTLRGAGPFTLFAPTDAAFAKLPAGVLTRLFTRESGNELVEVVQLHVASGSFKAAAVMTTSRIITLNGRAVSFSLAGKSVKIGDATIVKADVAARNGIIHVIDTVLLPPELTR